VLAPPTAHAGGAYSLEVGASTVINGSGSSDADGSIVTYEWDLNYDGSSFHVDASGATPTFSAAGLSAGVYTIALRVTDNDGNSHLATSTVTVTAPPPPVVEPPPTSPARLVDDPDQAGRKMLVVNGSSRSDRIRFKQVKTGVEVRVGRRSLGVFSGMTRIVVHGGRGNDTIDASKVRVPVALFGGVGNDHLTGSLFSDVLVGEDGNDHLDGNHGDDLLIGGSGRDHLHSRQGRDLLVGGLLKAGHALPSLTEVLSDWSSPLSAKGRGHRGIFAMFNQATRSLPAAVDDYARDMLHGTPGDDGLLVGKGDKIQKQRK
jgi:Ca2+-binding RTX toxin-like protein